MLDKLEQIEARYEALTEELSSPEVYSDPANYAKLNKQHRGLGEMVSKYRELKQLKSELAGARNVVCVVEAPPTDLPLDTLVTLPLIATEVVTSSLKHAWPEGG